MNKAHHQRAMMLIHQGRFDLAMDEVRHALGENPNDGELYAILSLCLQQRGQHREALEQAEHAVHLDPDAWWNHYVLAFAQRGMQRHDAALATAKQAAALAPFAAPPHLLMGEIHMHKSRWREALSCADHALSLDPADTGAANLRAMALTQLGERDEAARTIEGSLQRDPDNATSHANRGWALLHGGEPRKAMEHFAEALRLEPDLEWARRGIVEAMKARNIVYRTFLRIALWLGRLSPRSRWVATIGVIVLLQVLLRGTINGPLMFVGIAAALGYMAFVAFMWSSRPLFDAILMCDRFGRLALTPHEKRAAIAFVAACVVSVTYIAVDCAPRSDYLGAIDYLLLILAVGVAASVPPHGKWGVGYAIAGALYLIAAVYCYRWATFKPPYTDDASAMAWFRALTTTDAERGAIMDFFDSQRQLRQVFSWGAIGMTWLTGILHRRATPR